jgi:hypothetical protein
MKDIDVAAEIAQKNVESFAEVQEDFEPIIIRDGISLDEVLDFAQKHDKLAFRLHFVPDVEDSVEQDPRKILGKFIAHDHLLLDVHETTGTLITTHILAGIQTIIGDVGVVYEFEKLRIFKSFLKTLKEPDAGLRPVQLRSGGNVLDSGFGTPFPNVVVEIAFQNESLPVLQNELRAWLSNHTSVQVAIGIKIFGKKQDGTRRILALLFRRAGDVQSVEFGIDQGNIASHNLRSTFRFILWSSTSRHPLSNSAFHCKH